MGWRDEAIPVPMPSSATSGHWRDEAIPVDEHFDANPALSPEWKRRTTSRMNAARQAQLNEDEENRTIGDTIAHGLLGAANTMDAPGLADEYRGYFHALATGVGGAAGALSQGQLPDAGELGNAMSEAYRGQRDQQREATSMAEEQSPIASAVGQTLGQLPALAGSFLTKTPQLAAQALKNSPSLVATLGKAGVGGAGVGALSGLGHGEGDVGQQLESAGKGAAFGAAFGAGGALLPAGLQALAPKAAQLPVSKAALAAAGREAAGTVAQGASKAGRASAGAALDMLAKGATKAPLAAGAAVGGKLAGPLGAAAGGGIAQAALGDAAAGYAAKLEGLAGRVRGGPKPKPATLEGLQALLDEPLGGPPSSTEPSGLEVDRVGVELNDLRRRIARETPAPEMPVDDADVVGEQSATNPYASAYADAVEAKPVSGKASPAASHMMGIADAAERASGPVDMLEVVRRQVGEDLSPSSERPPPLPPGTELQAGTRGELQDRMQALQGALDEPISGFNISAEQMRSGNVPPGVRARLDEIAKQAREAEPSTTADASGDAGFDDGQSPAHVPVDEYGVPLESFPLEDTGADKPSLLRKGKPPASPPPDIRALLQEQLDAPIGAGFSSADTAAMPNQQLGRLRLQSSREGAGRWSDTLDSAEVRAFDEFGNETRSGVNRDAWRRAAARHQSPAEGGPSSTAGMFDEDVNALLERGRPTKGALQQEGSAYFPKRNALLGEQVNDPELAPSVQGSAANLVGTSRTAPPPDPEAFATAMAKLPPPLQAQALQVARQFAGPEYVAKVQKALASSTTTAAGFDEGLPSFVTKSADEMGLTGRNEHRSGTWMARESGENVPSTPQRRMQARHEREDRLPGDRAALLHELLEANGIGDHDSARADAAYIAWKNGGRRGMKPQAQLGGMLDAFNVSKDKPGSVSSLLEAFEHETKGLKTYRDLERVLPALSEALGVDVKLPQEVIDRHITQDVERGDG